MFIDGAKNFRSKISIFNLEIFQFVSILFDKIYFEILKQFNKIKLSVTFIKENNMH